MKRKILYISGTRADFGLMETTLKELDSELDLRIAVTGMHLMEEFGHTADEVKKEGFIIYELDSTFKEDNKSSMSEYVGRLIVLLTKLCTEIKPDIILLLGDRGEMLAGAIVGTYLGIATAHIHGGEISSTVDDYVRHAITKLSNIHLAASELSSKRIIGMGEEEKNVFVVGAPGLDAILNEELTKDIFKKYDLKEENPIIILIQHPVSLEFNKSAEQIKTTLDAIKETDDGTFQVIAIYPNSDAGGRAMIEVIESYDNIKKYKSIPHKDFLSLMNVADLMIGNSSSGIIESPSFQLATINIGTRQEGREQSTNVINTNYDKEEIKKAIKTALYDEEFKNTPSKNPYGDGKTSKRILKILKTIKLDEDLLNKKMQL